MDSANLPHTVYEYSPPNKILQKNHTLNPNSIPDLLTITRTSHKTKFIKHGEDVYLLVYLNDFAEHPFIRVPVSELHDSASLYMEGAHV